MKVGREDLVMCGLIVYIIIVFAATCMISRVPTDMIETRHEVNMIDLQTLVYINNNGEIIAIDWSDETRQIDIVNSDTTYIVHATNGYWVRHTLYLNVSDLE